MRMAYLTHTLSPGARLLLAQSRCSNYTESDLATQKFTVQCKSKVEVPSGSESGVCLLPGSSVDGVSLL